MLKDDFSPKNIEITKYNRRLTDNDLNNLLNNPETINNVAKIINDNRDTLPAKLSLYDKFKIIAMAGGLQDLQKN